MPRLIYVEVDGARHEVDAAMGVSVMEAAVKNSVPGIVAECGGACACATCHVYVAEDFVDRVEPAEAMERDMLEAIVEPRPTSRLACQITVTAAMDGLVVGIPAQQGL